MFELKGKVGLDEIWACVLSTLTRIKRPQVVSITQTLIHPKKIFFYIFMFLFLFFFFKAIYTIKNSTKSTSTPSSLATAPIFLLRFDPFFLFVLC